MGPSWGIGKSSHNKHGPKRNPRQQSQQAQWAHPEVSAGALIKIMGPSKTLGNSHGRLNEPILGHRQELS